MKVPVCPFCGEQMETVVINEDDLETEEEILSWYVNHYCRKETDNGDCSASFTGPLGKTEEESIELAKKKLYYNVYMCFKNLEGVKL